MKLGIYFRFLFLIILTCFLGVILAFLLFQGNFLDYIFSFSKQLLLLISEIQKENQVQNHRALSEQINLLLQSLESHQNQIHHLNEKVLQFENQQKAILDMYYVSKPGILSQSISGRSFSSFSSKTIQLMRDTHSLPIPSSWLRIKP
uniref:Uncharacterized protein n=1 Tax=Andalucia godoyi TaxID=505711 RepID=M4QBP0_ANDGO|nr:hypothetical protein L069_p023 [Andalucia godoyi]AGH24009.1 hypothetical protein [Andalucia godoyi]